VEERPETVEPSAPAAGGNGYPLREEATQPFPPPPPLVPEPPAEEIYAVAPAAPVAPRRRLLPAANPWPWLIAVILLLGGLGVAYAVTRPAPSHHGAASTPPAVAPPPAPSPAPPPTAPPTTSTAQNQPPPPAKPPPVVVPKLVGSSLPRAVSTLKNEGLTAIVAHVDSNAPEGQVVGQNPQAGAKLAKGGQVRVNVSVQPLVTVPNVTGIQGLQAVHTLQADHLVATVHYVPSTEPARRVLSQWPPAGRKVKRGTTELINVSQGNRQKGSSGPTGSSGSTG
jgi:PASTA domain